MFQDIVKSIICTNSEKIWIFVFITTTITTSKAIFSNIEPNILDLLFLMLDFSNETNLKREKKTQAIVCILACNNSPFPSSKVHCPCSSPQGYTLLYHSVFTLITEVICAL